MEPGGLRFTKLKKDPLIKRDQDPASKKKESGGSLSGRQQVINTFLTMIIKTPPPSHLISFTFKTILGFSHKSYLNNVMIPENIYIFFLERSYLKH